MEVVEDAINKKDMELVKLEQQEHIKTRALWEQVFKEDTKEFLDYYYSEKIKNNEMYVIKEDEKIISTIHLNPYQVRINDELHKLHYIVAVATDENYRKRGFMGQLLRKTMRVMYDRKEPFTFLMPAAEGIYHPYDFRYIYSRKQGEVCGKNTASDIEIVPVKEDELDELSDFANQMLEKYQVVTQRDANYYRTIILEQQSCGGDVMLIKKQGKLVGSFCYAKGEQFEIREPLFLEEEDFLKAIYLLTKNKSEMVKTFEYGEEQKPIIMVRILHLETFLKCLKLEKDVDMYIELEDKFIEENNGIFHIVGTNADGITKVQKIENETNIDKKIPIGDFTESVFGKYLSKVFLNEIV